MLDAGPGTRHNRAMQQHRGLGLTFRPHYRDRKSGERKTAAVWWIQYSHRGRRYRESSGSPVRSVAVALLKRRLGEIGRGRLLGPAVERTTWPDLADMIRSDYAGQARKSTKRMEQALTQLSAAFGHALALDVTADRLSAYVARRRAQDAAQATIRYELAICARAWRLGLLARRVGEIPAFPAIQVRNVRTGFLDEPAFRRVLGFLPKPLRPVAVFAYWTGWRLGELLALRWAQVDLVAQAIRLEPGTTKNDEGRTFPYAWIDELAETIRHQREVTSAYERAMSRIILWVFHRRGKPIRTFRRSWDLACEQAGVPGAWFHDLRRSAVRNLERAGVSRSVAMALTGHKTESIYRRYAIVSEADLAEGVRKLARLGEVSKKARASTGRPKWTGQSQPKSPLERPAG